VERFILKRHKKINSVKDFCKLILATKHVMKTVLITTAFCVAVLCTAILYGTRTNAPWYLLIIALPLMILCGGVEEIGWRGFLQPALDFRFLLLP
jgi:membrane protease YdiL (CAAX protease family)